MALGLVRLVPVVPTLVGRSSNGGNTPNSQSHFTYLVIISAVCVAVGVAGCVSATISRWGVIFRILGYTPTATHDSVQKEWCPKGRDLIADAAILAHTENAVKCTATSNPTISAPVTAPGPPRLQEWQQADLGIIPY